MNDNFRQRAWAVLAMLLIFVMSAVASAYKVTGVKHNVTLRQTPSTSAAALDYIDLDETVEVVDINQTWATVEHNGQRGYVLTKYLTPAQEQTTVKKKKSSSTGFLSGIQDIFKGNHSRDVRWLVWVIIGLLATQLILLKACEDGSVLRWAMPLLMLATSCVELYYGYYIHDFIWFCKEPRWYIIALNFLVFGACVYFQTITVIQLTHALSDDRGHIGIYSVPATVVLCIIFAFVAENVIPWILGAFVLCQIVQACLIGKSAFDADGFFYALICSLTYLVSMVATIMVIFQFLILLVIVVIGFIVLAALGSGSSSSEVRLRHKWGDYYEDQFGREWEWMGGNRYRRT